MKFLLVLTILATSTAFANERKIKCFEADQQGERGDLAYVFEENRHDIKLVFPEREELRLNRDECLESSHRDGGNGGATMGSRDEFEFCRGAGQEIRNLVPVEVSIDREEEETVYCERSILNWFEERDHDRE